MSHDHHRRRQEEVLRAVVATCREDAHVLGVTVAGSYARGENDAFSDLDMDCYLADEARTGVDELHRRVSALAPTLCVLYLYDRNGLYLFHDGIRLDLTYKPPSLMRVDRSVAAQILHDPRGVLATDFGVEYRPAPRAHPKYFTAGDPVYVTWFLWMFRQIYAWTKRGAQGGERGFDKLTAAADSLHRVRASLIEMWLWTLDRAYYGAEIDAEMAAQLADTYPRLVPVELLTATLALLAVYERICPLYCAKSGVAYPAEQVAALRRVLADFDGLH